MPLLRHKTCVKRKMRLELRIAFESQGCSSFRYLSLDEIHALRSFGQSFILTYILSYFKSYIRRIARNAERDILKIFEK